MTPTKTEAELVEVLFKSSIQIEAARMAIVNLLDGESNNYEANLVRDALTAIGDEARAALDKATGGEK